MEAPDIPISWVSVYHKPPEPSPHRGRILSLDDELLSDVQNRISLFSQEEDKIDEEDDVFMDSVETIFSHHKQTRQHHKKLARASSTPSYPTIFSLGSLGSEDDEEELLGGRSRERSMDSDGHVKPIDIYGAPLQKLPNVDFSKHMSSHSSNSSLPTGSTENLEVDSPPVYKARHAGHSNFSSMNPVTSSNLNKSKSVSTPTMAIGDATTHSRLLQSGLPGKSNRSSDLILKPGMNTGAQDNYNSIVGLSMVPSRKFATLPTPEMIQDLLMQHNSMSNEDDEKKVKKGGRRTSVFAKFGSVRKTSKSKDKLEKLECGFKKVSHNFVPLALPNSACNYCGKLFGVRQTYQCSNCLMNYHEDCKDRVPNCPKQKVRERKIPSMHPSTQSRLDNNDALVNAGIGDSYSPSMESLVDEGNADDEYEDDPDLNSKTQDPESWSETIDKKVIKGYKAKYIQRQDNIWELIATEKQYLLNLKIMQKVFVHGMRNECSLPDSAIERIFPELDNLIDIHQTFLTALSARQDKKADKSIDQIGDVIILQFGGDMGERMKAAYGKFCSRHKEGIDYYKHLFKVDRKFQNFIKKTQNMACTKRRGVQDLVTVVTMRMTKYKTLIENIIKNTKESKEKSDKENLMKALELNKDILSHIDRSIHDRNQELRLIEIYNKMDARSTAVYDKCKKFKKSDLLDKGRKLKHEGILSWRNARDKEVEMLVVALSDVIIFLQENDKKYSFFSQDSKASVIPLANLLVREKGSTKDNRGIYLIRQSRENPEMYELVCRSAQDRKEWTERLMQAIIECPDEDEGIINESDSEVHKEVIAKLAKLKEYLESLDYKHQELDRLFRERFSIITDIMAVYSYTDILHSIKSCHEDDGELKSADELMKLALDETAMLASMCQTVPPSSNLGRSWSSVGERQSPTYSLALPRRAETFNGFDQDQVKSPSGIKTFFDKSDLDGKSPSLLNLNQQVESDGEGDNTKSETTRNTLVNRRSSSNILQQMFPGTNRQEESDHVNDLLLVSSNMANVTALIPPTREQAQCAAQLTEYIHGLLLIISKQDSVVENLRQQLAESKVRSLKMESEQEKKLTMRYNKQMEEIRNRHAQLTKEREILENEKETLSNRLESEKTDMELLRAEIEKQQNDLKKEKEDLRRQKEALQKQIDFYGGISPTALDRTTQSTSSSQSNTPLGSTSDLSPKEVNKSSDTTISSPSVSHRRSQSAELVDNPSILLDPRFTNSLTEPLNLREARSQSILSETQAKTNATGSLSSLTQLERQNSNGLINTALKNKQNNNNTVQQSKLVQPNSSKSATLGNKPKNIVPLGLVESTKKLSDKGLNKQKKNDVYYF